jgi:hypothetical protein
MFLLPSSLSEHVLILLLCSSLALCFFVLILSYPDTWDSSWTIISCYCAPQHSCIMVSWPCTFIVHSGHCPQPSTTRRPQHPQHIPLPHPPSSILHLQLSHSGEKIEDPEERFLRVLQYYLAGWHIKPKGVKRPYNPILGEFFRCRYPDGLRGLYIAEQSEWRFNIRCGMAAWVQRRVL